MSEEKVASIELETIDTTNITEDTFTKKKRKRPPKRKFDQGILKWAVTVIALLMSAYHLIAAIVIGINPMQHRAVHLLFVLVLVYMLFPASNRSPKNKPSVLDWVMIVLSIAAVGNTLIRFQALASSGGKYLQTDIYFGALLIVLVIEAARRATGNALPIFAIIMLLYGLYGRYVPSPLKHGGFSITRIVRHLCLSTEGIYGQILGVSATYIFLFVLFGAFLSATGMSRVFNDLALALAGGSRGGPAKVSVLASGFMGSISGSTSANVVTTGAFTIPLMKKMGYEDYFSGAVEAAASTGGQIMPPVMGSASFIMADSLGIPYSSVLKAALIPAVLYYLGVWFVVDFRARRLGLSGLKKSELPSLKDTILKRGHLLIPLVGIIYMLVSGYSAIRAALVGIALAVVSSFLRKETRIKPKALMDAMVNGAVSALSVASACALIGIIIGIFSLSGAILSIGSAVLKLAGGKLISTLLLTTLVSIIMGMGLPTTACYILTSTIAAPAITQLGMQPIQAHMFVFFYGILSSVTPPVATGAYTAAGLAGSDPNKTGFAAVKLALAGFLIPFMFIYNPELLLIGDLNVLSMIQIIVTAVIGIFSLGIAAEGFFFREINLFSRLAAILAAVMLIDSGALTDIIGLALVAVVMAIEFIWHRKNQTNAKKAQ